MRAVPLGVIACRNLVDALPDTLAIVRPGDAMLTAMLREAGARVLPCPDAALGMGHTLACAIAASRDADGWVVALADMPWLRISTIRSIADSLRAGAAIVAPAHRGKRGNPVGFSSRYAEALASLEGDRGARGILALAGAALQTIELDDDGVLRDVDARGDL